MWIFDTISSPTYGWTTRNGPSDCGTIEVNTTYVRQTSVAVVLFKSITSLAMLGGMGYWAFHWQITQLLLPSGAFSKLAIIVGVEMMYVAIAFLFVPRPNYNNVGFLGGLVNNPWKYSDNYNRSLRTWRILLGPGRFISSAILDFAGMLGWMKGDPTDEERFAQEMEIDWSQGSTDASLNSATRVDLDMMPLEEPAAAVATGKVNRGDFD
ncbi:hypothetical protein [Blastopirellula retiformator]|uniref:Uncharacterized protein n=1 Tax=Blastopirellula retiformator TaxID=2527970 RepID=A0A5C5UVY7_9BACT|nr:hypothetical protein [Blastopirellula retiformator]TWT30029.1 hypothetical protein Enr8_46860 [Blastopirellula retiformator]